MTAVRQWTGNRGRVVLTLHDGGAYVWRAELEPLLEKSKIMVLAGVRRRAFFLEHFTLVRGVAPGWYSEAQERKRYSERQEAGNMQMALFDDSASCRLRYEL